MASHAIASSLGTSYSYNLFPKLYISRYFRFSKHWRGWNSGIVTGFLNIIVTVLAVLIVIIAALWDLPKNTKHWFDNQYGLNGSATLAIVYLVIISLASISYHVF